jgi:putative endonuclease
VSEKRRRRGADARLSGRRGEVVAALWLMAKGYRILGFRHRLPQGEIDLLAKRGRVLIAVEVKARTSLEAALEAVSFSQRQRLRRALRAYVARRPRLAAAEVRLDLVALAPGRFPRHIRGAWSEDDS